MNLAALRLQGTNSITNIHRICLSPHGRKTNLKTVNTNTIIPPCNTDDFNTLPNITTTNMLINKHTKIKES